MKRQLGAVILLAGLILAGLQIVSIWQDSYPLGVDSVPEDFLKAIRHGSLNPDPFFRLGLFYQWDLRSADLERAVNFLREAIERNPLNQDYWLSLAGVLQRRGEAGKAEKALEKAVAAAPQSYQGRWGVGNSLLQMGEHEKALNHYSFVLAHYPDKSFLIFDVLERAYKDSEPVIERVIPKTPAAFSGYLSYLYETGNLDRLKRVWAKGPSFGYQPDRGETIRYVDTLISRGDFTEAYQAYVSRLRTEGRTVPRDGNLLINGGFEEKAGMGGGFDWRISAPPGAEVSFSPETAWEGKTSLKVSFNGKENVDFHHVFQFAAWKPNRSYILQAKVKTRGLTTQSGIQLDVFGVGKPFYASSEVLTGDQDWKDLKVSFRTPDQSQGGVVRLRRAKTEKLDRFIEGNVWIDDVRLTEVRGN
jgi:tetratricopeptide (TPR) repeat protein